MSRIKIERPTEKMLKELGIDKWSPWECEPSTFDWEYPADETAYVFEGRVKVKTKDEEVEIKKGDLVTFPKGLKCKWNVIERIRKAYIFNPKT
ncbi:MAG: cupin [Deltaproteobacteria bacterium GWC2_42_51]|nr:MAG: cupin [Deltaproteobacteria bacterium GWB2_42_7]OGP34259.1 MAG: cupin [Deltaproteobacteria bacterium GWC2_42_51]OGP44635.1 MAG: cupin [Deltaproteobacteria bacterium GWD2_42_10]OGP47892.1 MAG: cupin [Deltaproteobacteria bacterium GWF2_42_12]OGQ35598.1 MAG: cupin [Deltaproteobacteria bacterium RIFCSPLOWO2_02_FULL_42_39]OGQ65431.1 MAG: cupin [Deltaproteobacteria bacterium RIFCSPLOWO2_12_FULL_42_16]OGQ73347.1 MAG: cupin [Deltaproteobacteria bacterium RIFOXYA2_FULL_42_10]